MTIHCCSLVGVGTVMLKPVPGVYRLVATVGAANVCWKYCSNALTDIFRASPLLGRRPESGSPPETWLMLESWLMVWHVVYSSVEFEWAVLTGQDWIVWSDG
jgi:hypothetical protein